MPDLAIGRAVSPGRTGSQIGPAPRWLLLFCLFLALPVAAQAMYKWVDEKGVTHYSEHPPADAKLEKKAAKVTPRVTPPSNASAYDPNAWKGKEAEAKKRQVSRGQQEQTDARDAARQAEACERARSRLGMLQTSAPIFRTNPDGSRTYMEDKTREAEIARAREVADQACR